jgi:hypothetical protein
LKAVKQERAELRAELKTLSCLILAAQASENEKEVDALRADKAVSDAKELKLLDIELVLRRTRGM